MINGYDSNISKERIGRLTMNLGDLSRPFANGRIVGSLDRWIVGSSDRRIGGSGIQRSRHVAHDVMEAVQLKWNERTRSFGW
jgi:hypothetical protein